MAALHKAAGEMKKFLMFEQTRLLIIGISKRLAIVILAAAVVAVTGCHKQTDASSQLANAVKVLEKSDPGQPPAPATSVAAPAAPSGQASPEVLISQPVAQQMKQAMTAYKTGDYQDTITRLEWLRNKATKTADQTMAIQDAMAAVMTDLYARAEKGDARAQQAIKQHQATRNQP